MSEYDHLLTEEEQARNRHATAKRYYYNSKVRVHVPSPDVAAFPALKDCSVTYEIMSHPHSLPGTRLRGLCPGVDLRSYLPGFPSFQHLRFSSTIRRGPVVIFQQPSRNASVLLRLQCGPADHTIEQAAPLIGQVVWVNWPHLLEAKVVAVSSETEKIEFKNNQATRLAHGRNEAKSWTQSAKDIQENSFKTFGIETGPVRILVHVQRSEGTTATLTATGTFVQSNRYAPVSTAYPLQLVVVNPPVYRGANDLQEQTLAERFQPGSEFCFLGQPHYGSLGQVVEVDHRKFTLDVTLTTRQQPDLQSVLRRQHQPKDRMRPIFQVATELGIQADLVNRIVASLIVDVTGGMYTNVCYSVHGVNGLLALTKVVLVLFFFLLLFIFSYYPQLVVDHIAST